MFIDVLAGVDAGEGQGGIPEVAAMAEVNLQAIHAPFARVEGHAA